MSWPWGPSIAEKKSDTFDPWYPDHFDRRTNIAVDWKETPEAHIFTADIPGLTKEEVKIEVDEGVRALKISGELPKHESVDEKSKFHRFERLHGSFWRRFPLPKNARLDGEVKAKMEKGVLTVTIPKRPGPETGRRSIQICG